MTIEAKREEIATQASEKEPRLQAVIEDGRAEMQRTLEEMGIEKVGENSVGEAVTKEIDGEIKTTTTTVFIEGTSFSKN